MLLHTSFKLPLQWGHSERNINSNTENTETYPVTVGVVFTVILSDTNCTEGNSQDASGGSTVTGMYLNRFTWYYDWNYSQIQNINYIIIGKS